MIVGVGLDIVHIPRVRDLVTRYGERFLDRLFLPDEISYCQRGRIHHSSFAAHIAAKEAAAKALGSGWRQGVHWKCVEVAHEPSGKPRLRLHEAAGALADRLGVARIAVSLTHDGDYALAQVVMEA